MNERSASGAVRRVVVGLDGSEESRAALRWAAGVVGVAGRVDAVAAVPPALELAVAAVQADSAALVDRVTRDLETDWVADVRASGHQIETRVVEDHPAEALLRVADDVDADLVVVGVHAKPRHAPRTIGRVTARLIRESARPLAVVDRDGDRPTTGATTVVVDAAGGAATPAVTRWAAAYADARDTPLTLVRAIPDRPVFGPDGLLDVLAFYVDRAMLHDWALDDLVELAAEIQRSTGRELDITWSVDRGSVARRLIEASIDAGLIVLGREAPAGAGHIVPMAMHRVLTHAPCPVVVVPPSWR